MASGFKVTIAAAALLTAGSIAASAATCMPSESMARLFNGSGVAKAHKTTVCSTEFRDGQTGGSYTQADVLEDTRTSGHRNGHRTHGNAGGFGPFGGNGGSGGKGPLVAAADQGDDDPSDDDPSNDDPVFEDPIFDDPADPDPDQAQDDPLDPGQMDPPSPVPLPAAGWLLVGGLAGLGLVRRRKS